MIKFCFGTLFSKKIIINMDPVQKGGLCFVLSLQKVTQLIRNSMFWNRGGNNVGLMSIFLTCSVTSNKLVSSESGR